MKTLLIFFFLLCVSACAHQGSVVRELEGIKRVPINKTTEDIPLIIEK